MVSVAPLAVTLPAVNVAFRGVTVSLAGEASPLPMLFTPRSLNW